MDILKNVNLNLLKSFWAVYKTGGINKGAKMLDMTPPTVTHNIKQLEKQLGHKLFVTGKKGADPTDKAKEIFPLVENIFENLQKFNEQLGNENKGTIRIGTSAFHTEFYLINFHRKFMSKYPNIKLEFYHHPHHDYLTMLENNQIDVAIMQFLKRPASDIIIFELFSDSMSFFTSKQFAIANNIKNEITFEQFLKLPFICHSQSRTVLDKLERAFEHKLPVIETPSVQVAYDMVVNGKGIGIFFDRYLDANPNDKIVRIKINDKPQPPSSVYECAYHKKPSALVSLYIREIKDFFAN